jgi:hypothetical protein
MSQHLADSVMAGGRTLAEVCQYSPPAIGLVSSENLGMANHVYFGAPLFALLGTGLVLWAASLFRRGPDARTRAFEIALVAALALGVAGVVLLALGAYAPWSGLPIRAARRLVPQYTMIRQTVKIYCLLPALLAPLLAVGEDGVRLWRLSDLALVGQDKAYQGESYGAAFDGQGRLATTCYDGFIRLYQVSDTGLVLLAKTAASGGHRPFSLAFSPDGSQLAVGFTDTAAVDVLDAKTLSLLGAPNLRGVDNGNLASVAFAADGSLLAAGRWVTDRGCPVRRFVPADYVQYRDLDTGKSAVVTLCPLPDGGLAYGTVAPRWGVLRPDGSFGMTRSPAIQDYRSMVRSFLLDRTGDDRGLHGPGPAGAVPFLPAGSGFAPAERSGARSRRRAYPGAGHHRDGLGRRTRAGPQRPAPGHEGFRDCLQSGHHPRCQAVRARHVLERPGLRQRRPGRCGRRLCPTWPGPSMSVETAGWWPQPWATAPSAGTVWRTAGNCWPISPISTASAGCCGRPRAIMTRPPAVRTLSAGT